MSDVLKIGAGPAGRRLSDDDLPFPVTVLRGGEVVFGDTARAAPALWIGLADGRLFVQPEGGVKGLLRNGAPLDRSAWLDAGDTLRLGGADIAVSVEDGLFVLSDVAAADEQSQAPHRAPPRMKPPPRRRLRHRVRPGGRRLRLAVAAVLALLAIGAGLVLAVSPVRIRTEPPADSVSLTGMPPAVPFFGRYLALPGRYTVTAEKPGYRRLEQPLDVALGSKHDLVLRLRELPGFLDIAVSGPDRASLSIDGKPVGETPLSGVEVDAGSHALRATAPRYKPKTQTVDVAGKGAHQTVEMELDPAWGTLVVETEPAGASVTVDGEAAGETPLSAQPLEGTHRIRIEKPKWKPVARDVAVVAGQTLRLPPVRLEKSDGILSLTSTPAGAEVAVDGAYRGRTPLSAPVAADADHEVKVSKSGFRTERRTARAGPEETTALDVRLAPEFGTVFILARPPDAKLAVDGKPMGRASRRLRLTTAPHRLEISRAGYETHRATVTPKPGVPSRLNVTLRTEKEVARAEAAKHTTTAAGQKLVPVWIDRPVTFRVGSSRGEAGRRSNEARYRVELTRSFLIGAREVTNAQFRAFRANHHSGSVGGVSLDDPDQPVATVSWDDAARYLNWLSAKDGLKPAYVEKGGHMVAAEPMTTGYRLPTEAEWVYAARYLAGLRAPDRPLTYPWGDAMPPTGKAGNFADASARRVFPDAIPSYSDGFVGSAPVGRFAPSRAGLYDMGGNVSEWCHDFYGIRAISPDTVLRDPTGPDSGRYHVVRGSSWRHGSVAELRFAWRDFGDKPRNDLGFRIARYAD